MKVLYVAESSIPSRSANSIQVMRMCQAFAEGGADIELLVSWQPQKLFLDPVAFFSIYQFYGVRRNFRIRFVFNPIVPFRTRAIGRVRIACFRALATRQVLRRRPDVVYTRSLVLAAELVKRGICVAVECHEYGRFRDTGALHALAEVAQLPSLWLIVVISDNLRRLYVDFGIPKEKILVEHDGVDSSLFDCGDCKMIDRRPECGILGAAPVVCYSGKMTKDRGIELLIGAANLLPEVYFLFVGGTRKAVKGWRNYAKDLDNTVFTGFVRPSDVPSYVQLADVLAAPYTRGVPHIDAISPLKLFEYMAAGKPVVISRFPSIGEVVTDGYDAIVVEPDSVESLVSGIRKAMTEDGKEIGRNARKTVEGYTWQARASRILGALRACWPKT